MGSKVRATVAGEILRSQTEFANAARRLACSLRSAPLVLRMTLLLFSEPSSFCHSEHNEESRFSQAARTNNLCETKLAAEPIDYLKNHSGAAIERGASDRFVRLMGLRVFTGAADR